MAAYPNSHYQTQPNEKLFNFSPLSLIKLYCVSTCLFLHHHVCRLSGILSPEPTKWGEKSFMGCCYWLKEGLHSGEVASLSQALAPTGNFKVALCFAHMSLECWNVPGTCRGPPQTQGEHASYTQRGPKPSDRTHKLIAGRQHHCTIILT